MPRLTCLRVSIEEMRSGAFSRAAVIEGSGDKVEHLAVSSRDHQTAPSPLNVPLRAAPIVSGDDPSFVLLYFHNNAGSTVIAPSVTPH